ncbi:MAG: YggT family protein [Phyllobacteriaceae bacterium]|nr:YggT family protein [Phyllobacteriaceae bacterium]
MDFWGYWYFHLPNYVLAALQYTVLGRLLLGFFVADDWDNYIWKAFKRLTDPVVRLVRAVTPAALPHNLVLAFAVLWILAARVAFIIILLRAGLAPAVSSGG